MPPADKAWEAEAVLGIPSRGFRIPEALPPLRGWAASLYVAIWLPMLAVTLAGTLGGAWYRAQEGAGAAYSWHALGLSLRDGDNRIERMAGDETHAAGVKPGDRVLSIDGIALPPGAVSDDLDRRVKLHLLETHRPVPLVVQRQGRPPRTVMLTRSDAHGAALYAGTGVTPRSLSQLATAVSLFASLVMVGGAGLLFGRRRDPVAALLSLALLGMATGASWAYLFWLHLGMPWMVVVLSTIGTLGMFLTIATFPNGRLVPRWTIWLLPAVPVLIVQDRLVPTASPWTVPLFALIALIAMGVRYRRQPPADRRQWRWAFIGFGVGTPALILGATLYGQYLAGHKDFGSALWSWILTPLSITVPLTIITAGVVLSVMRYRLYDTQAAVSRSVLYGALTLTLLAIFAGSEKIIEIIGEDYFGESIGAFAGGLGAAFAAVAVSPLHHRLSHWVEHRFRKNLIHLRHDLPPLLVELGETSDPATVARTMLDQLAHGLHATRGAVVANGAVLAAYHVEAAIIGAPPIPTRPARIGTVAISKRDPLFPMRLSLAGDGSRWLLIGPRPDDSLYDRQERELLSELASPLAQALRVSADRTTREAALTARIDLIERELQALRAAGQPIETIG